jgi:hypothetical protein
MIQHEAAIAMATAKRNPKTKTSDIQLWRSERKLYKLVCCYCTGAIGSGNLDVDGYAAHKSCHREACK